VGEPRPHEHSGSAVLGALACILRVLFWISAVSAPPAEREPGLWRQRFLAYMLGDVAELHHRQPAEKCGDAGKLTPSIWLVLLARACSRGPR
jgi:hypothetical protein